MLEHFVFAYREDIIRRCRRTVAGRSAPPPTATEMNHGVPLFLDRLIDALRLELSLDPPMSRPAAARGTGFPRPAVGLSQAVDDYGGVRQAITELATEKRAPISSEDFRILNRCLDEAMTAHNSDYRREPDRDKGGAAARPEAIGWLTRITRLAATPSANHLVSNATPSAPVQAAGARSTAADERRRMVDGRSRIGQDRY